MNIDWLKVAVSALLVPCLAYGQTEGRGDGSVTTDSVKHVGFSVYVNPGTMLAMDDYVKRWLKKKGTTGIGFEMNYMTLPSDSSAFASDFGYPTISVGVRYTLNNRVRMHRDPDPSWGKIEEVDYDSHLGNTVSLYASFNRPFVRTRHWETDYTLGIGLGYSSLIYNTKDDIDNEMIGSHLLVYFNLGLHITYHPVPQWGVRAGLELVHHSNGALDRPNKGSNAVGPSLGLTYTPYYESVVRGAPRYNPPFKKYWYVNLTAGFGGKTLMEDWNLTQFNTDPGDPDYRTDEFNVYATVLVQADIMYRYARRWASGLGLDVFYGSYHNRVASLDEAAGYDMKHSPWSVALAAKHEVFFGRWSAPMTVGYYLFRHMGHNAEQVEKPYYERIGVHYNFPKLGGLSVGVNLNAHALKADFTEISVGMPFVLK